MLSLFPLSGKKLRPKENGFGGRNAERKANLVQLGGAVMGEPVSCEMQEPGPHGACWPLDRALRWPGPLGLADLTSSALLEHPMVKLDSLPVFFLGYFAGSVTHSNIGPFLAAASP